MKGMPAVGPAAAKVAGQAAGLAVAVLAAGWMTAGLRAQDSEPVFRDDVAQVDVLATVRDKKDHLVPDLQQSNFRVFEDGVEQEIRRFAKESDLPLTIGVLVDVSTSVQDKIPEERRAANQFLKQVLRPQDKAFVIGFAGKAVLLQDVTASLSDLQDGLADLESAARPTRSNRYASQGGGDPEFFEQQFQGRGRFPMPGGYPPMGGGGRFPGGGGGRYPGGGGGGRGGFTGTVFYDAIYLSADDVLKKLTGRKVVVVISDGMDLGSRVSLSESMEALVKSDVIAYNIHVKPDGFLMRGGEGEDVMDRISDKTGGRVFQMANTNKLEKIFAEIEDELRSQYSISYSPKRGVKGSGYRKIEVRVDRKEHKVRAREGYYPLSESGEEEIR